MHRVEQPVIADSMPMRVVTMSVRAEFPSPAGDYLEDEIDPMAWVVLHPASTLLWRVEGDYLSDVGIRDGDIIAVRRAGKKRLGRAVLAVVEGAVTAKILWKRGEQFYLVATNSQEQYPDIELAEDSEIWGVIAGVVRKWHYACRS